MRWLIPVWMVAACASQPPAGDDDAPVSDGGNGGGGGDDITPGPDAAPPVEPCDPHAFVIEPVAAWGGFKVVSQFHLPVRIAPDGAIDLDYAVYPNQGGPRRQAHRAPGGGWTFTDSDALVFGNVVHTGDLECHVARTDLTTSGRYQLWCNGEVVAPDANVFFISGAITPDGVHHVFYNVAAQAAAHAWRAPGGAWEHEEVPGKIGFASVVVDADGCFRVAYAKPAGGPIEVRYAVRCGDEEWQDELVERDFRSFWLTHASLALDADGRPHVLYPAIPTSPFGTQSGPLHHARRDDDGTWHVEPVAVGANASLLSQSIAIAPDGDLHAAYHVQDGEWQYHVEHLRRTPAGVETRTSLGTSMYSGSTTTAIAPDGEVVVVYDREVKRIDLARACY